jgi:hypothetical protein
MRGVRTAVLLISLAACDLQPPPPKPVVPVAAAAPSVAPTPAPRPVPAAPVTVPPPAPVPAQPMQPPPPPVPIPNGQGGSAYAPPPVSAACEAAGTHIADVLIANADPAQKAVLQQDRPRLLKASGQSCAKNAWNDAKISCFNAATTMATLDTCNKLP